MVGFIVPNSSLNSFGSICYCVITLGIHAYACYKDIVRYQEADERAWPSNGGEPPTEVTSLLGFTVLSLLVMPFFCAASFIKVGNLANDGVKLGRDFVDKTAKTSSSNAHEAAADAKEKHNSVACGRKCLKKKAGYLWKHFCPVAQTMHLFAAFSLLLPEVLLTAVEINNGYKSADIAWESELDFLFPEDRAIMSHIISSVNLTTHPNATRLAVPSTRVTPGGWGDRISVSIAFVHFCIALACFLVRYASVFWYTNKPLTLVFAFQLLSMVLNSIFGFNSFATLYCVCYNQKIFINVSLSISCGGALTLYLISGTILLLSTITAFEYGSHYFHEKSKIVERSHASDTYTKRTVIVNSGCQGYIPHSCAMAALVAFAMCKAPLIYDMVHLMRLTSDELMVSAVICEVCYMVTWVMLWFGLTVKQKWKFRILDYVTLQQMKSLPLDGHVMQINSNGRGDSIDSGSLNRLKRLSNSQTRSLEPTNAISGNSSCEDRCPSDVGTEESEQSNMAASHVLRADPYGVQLVDSSSLKRARGRRVIVGPRVTFNNDPSRHSGNFEEEPMPPPPPTYGCLNRRTASQHSRERTPEVSSHVNVTADIHTSTLNNVPSQLDSSTSSSQRVVSRRYSDHAENPLNKEYRNSLRGKCDEMYASETNTASTCEDLDSPTDIPPMEPLPTLMSSFRDRVRESSLAASSFKEREKNMLERYHTYDEHLTNPTINVEHCEQLEPAEQSQNPRHSGVDRCTETQYHHPLQNHHHDGHPQQHNNYYEYSHPGENFNENTDIGLKYRSLSSDEGQSVLIANSTHESSDSGLPTTTVLEDAQLGHGRRKPRDEDLAGDENRPHHPQQPQQHHQQQQQQQQQQQHQQQQQQQQQHPHPHHHQHHSHHHPQQLPTQHPRQLMVKLGGKKVDMGRRDSANFSLTSSQDTSSNESDHGQGLCSQV